jgi:hypothetical protein
MTSLFAAMQSFHNAVARYMFALGLWLRSERPDVYQGIGWAPTPWP